MSLLTVLKILRKRDSAGKFAPGPRGDVTEGAPPPEDETPEERARRAMKLRLAAEQKARREREEEKQRKRRDVPEAKL